MTESTTDCIHKKVSLRAPQSRVWKAITDSKEFGEWFRVRLEGPFQLGETIQGFITHPGYEHMKLVAKVERMEPAKIFALRWCPYAMDPEVDYSGEPTTLTEFLLEPSGDGTLLTITESGFDSLPEKYRSECFVRNESGWTGQLDNIKAHVDN